MIAWILTGMCPTGWKSGPNRRKCFTLISNSSSWDVSEAACQNRSGHLAALTSVQELQYVKSICRNGSNGCWVGGHGVNSRKGFSWEWSDHRSHWNNSVFPGAPSPLNCTNSSCLNTNLTEFCTLVTNGQVALVGDRCKTSHDFVCMLSKGRNGKAMLIFSFEDSSRLPGNRCELRPCHKEYIIILAVVSGLILSTTLAVVIWLLAYRRSKRRRRSRKISSPSSSALVPPSWRVYTNEELRITTKNFSEGNRLLGDAKTGGTYRGLLPDGSLVAVKRLKKSSFQSKKEFLSEIGRIARLRHPNLVAVKGCCYEHGERYIVYEFVANGPLDRWLHHLPRGARSLDWVMRMRIATTLAQGIAPLNTLVAFGSFSLSIPPNANMFACARQHQRRIRVNVKGLTDIRTPDHIKISRWGREGRCCAKMFCTVKHWLNGTTLCCKAFFIMVVVSNIISWCFIELNISLYCKMAKSVSSIRFLHDKVKPHVVHRDIRANNVLLDEEFGAHILGVGLSKFVPWEAMHERTVMAGTYGYLAPEFVYRNELTTKSDVYSFGVLLLELISGRKPAQTVESVDWQNIFEWATPLVQSHRYTELLDPVITDIPEVGQIQKVVDLVYTCTQHVPSMRPRMSYVVHQLQQLELKVVSEAGRAAVGSCSAMSLEKGPLWGKVNLPGLLNLQEVKIEEKLAIDEKWPRLPGFVGVGVGMGTGAPLFSPCASQVHLGVPTHP
eukprot:Gb_32037 [translate_table: standard]